MNLNELKQEGLLEDEMITWDGFDDAVIGVTSRCGSPSCLLYSVKKMVYILRDRDGMDIDEAMEYLDFNIRGAYVGDHTPMLLEDWI